MKSCARKIHFSYGHRVLGHESKCGDLHGHNAVVWIHATPTKELDSLGRVVDFSVIKDKVGGWIEKNWDHTMILFADDKKALDLLEKIDRVRPLFRLPVNPTAENLANYLLWKVCPEVLKGHNVIVYKITFWETENSVAEESLDPTSEKVLKLY